MRRQESLVRTKDYALLPISLTAGIRRYIEFGIQPASAGLSAVLANDLSAIVRVDDATLADLPSLYRWLCNYAPPECWGSLERITAWMKARREACSSGTGASDLATGDHLRDLGKDRR